MTHRFVSNDAGRGMMVAVKRLVLVAACWVALTLSMGVFAAGVPIGEATKEQTATARSAYVTAKKAYDQGKYDEALSGFQSSYDAVASPNSHMMIAKTLRSMGRLADAYREAKLTLVEAERAAEVNEKYATTAEHASTMLQDMQAEVGFVTIRVAPAWSGRVTVNGRAVDDLDQPVVVDPGPVTVALAAPHGLEEQALMISRGGTALVEFAPSSGEGDGTETGDGDDGRSDEGLSVPQIVGISAAGVGVAGMIVFGVFGAAAVSTFDDLEAGCPNGNCPPELAGDVDDGMTYQTVANAGLVVGVAGLIAGVALIVLPIGHQDAASEAEPSAGLSLGPGTVSLIGTF